MRPCHVLIIEDERHIAKLLEHVLRTQGYQVSVAHDAEKALALIKEIVPDAVLLDLVLPGMSGLDFLKQVRSNARWDSLAVIVLSGQWFQHDDQTLVEAGATAQCPKPIAPSKLLRTLHDCGMTPELGEAAERSPV